MNEFFLEIFVKKNLNKLQKEKLYKAIYLLTKKIYIKRFSLSKKTLWGKQNN